MERPSGTKRSYDSPVRRRRARATRDRIVAAAATILHEQPVWDWNAVSIRSVAARAEVNERTVYRHFDSERALREAVLERLEQESGVDVTELTLEGVQAFAQRLLGYVASFPVRSRTTDDPTLLAAGDRKRRALLDAVADAKPGWTEQQQRIAAASIDVLWSVGTHERLVSEWGLTPDDAITAVTWTIGLVEAGIADDRPPRRPPTDG